MTSKKRVIVVCPGRGSYNQEQLGYLNQHAGNQKEIVEQFDAWRKQRSEPTITELDSAEKFQSRIHSVGENASPLIQVCAYVDYFSIDREKFDVVAITGNSMGWYLGLGVAGALNLERSFHLVQTMGSMMKDGLIGGQVLYPVVDSEWCACPQKKADFDLAFSKASEDGEIFESIRLGGFIVVGGDEKALRSFMKHAPAIDDRYPMKLMNHGAFHTPMLDSVSSTALSEFAEDFFSPPEIPLIDGRGKIWQPYSTDPLELRDYTLGHQVVQPFEYTSSIRVALKEFAPDGIILLGPGESLGAPTAQVMIENRWLGLTNKKQFIDIQKKDPFVFSMGRPEQRDLVTGQMK
ncbi:hypothetical protein N9D31_02810 [Oligoflexaceae bacterium]|nr:hypothetical protein [Oligoflexaceae bacterium]